MAERRMFAKKITESDAFCGMPASTQCYYFHLCQNADDEGFVNSPKKVMDYTHSAPDDFNLLVAKKFIIPFDSGIVVIKGWYIHNLLRKDRATETEYKEERDMLFLDDSNYHLKTDDNQLSTNRQPTDNQPTPQYSIGEGSIGKLKESNSAPTREKPIFHKHGKYGWIKLTDEQYQNLLKEYGSDFIEKAINGLDEYVQGNGNKNEYKDWNLTLKKAIRDKWNCVCARPTAAKPSSARNFNEREYSKSDMDAMFSDIHNLDNIDV